MMPTTRKGRYKLYRDRILQRMRRARNRRANAVGASNPLGRHPTTREAITTGYPLQLPKRYPLKEVWGGPMPEFPDGVVLTWRVKPGLGVWGVIEWTPPYEGYYHLRHGLLDYFHRRLTKLPKLRHLGKKPYLHTQAEVASDRHYPASFPTYPSGQANPWYVP